MKHVKRLDSWARKKNVELAEKKTENKTKFQCKKRRNKNPRVHAPLPRVDNVIFGKISQTLGHYWKSASTALVHRAWDFEISNF